MALEFEYRDEELRQRKRAQRIEQMRLEREKQLYRRKMIKKYAPLGLAGFAILVLLIVLIVLLGRGKQSTEGSITTGEGATTGTEQAVGGQNNVQATLPPSTE